MGYFSRIQKDDEPLTPVGRLFSRRELYQIMNCAVTIDGPIDVELLKAELASSAFTRLPRFTSLFRRHPRTGREFWRKTGLVLDQHVKVIDEDYQLCDNVNDYLADLAVSCPLPTDKPLWEVHILKSHNCIVFRVHHSLADGMSFMSLLQSLFGGISKPAANRRKSVATTTKKKSFFELIKMAWFTLIFVIEFILRCLFVKDKKTVVTGGDGVQLWPRKLATASFTLEDMNIVKKSVLPNATINDVMLGVLSSGLSEYMDLHSPNATREGQKMTVVVMVNLRSVTGIPEISDLMKADSRSGWGNKISFMLHPIQFHKPKEDQSDPLLQLKMAKASMDRKKLSKVARLSYIVGNLAKTFFGPNVATWLLYRMTCNTTFAFSNIVGPSQEVTLLGKRVTLLKLSVSSVPHAMTIHMLSYNGKAEMQILVAKDIIPDPEILAKCFEDALQRMKKAAIGSSEAYERLLC
ncbi:hypothetical protein QQ045_023180 [Rhodiola kirilowii]